MNEMLLLGAGASVEAGVPASIAMTQKIVEIFNNPDRHQQDKFRHIINFVTGGLLFKVGESNENPFHKGVDVEDLFNAVLLLTDRNSLEMSPFVGSWHSMVEHFDRVEPPPPDIQSFTRYLGDELERLSSSDFRRTLNYRELARQLEKAFRHRYQSPGNGGIFRRIADEMIFLLADLVWIDDTAKVEYLSPIITRGKRDGRIVVATLNYDNAVELASKYNSFPCNIGIEASSGSKHCKFSDEGLQLIKLHGSIDWRWNVGPRDKEKPMQYSTLIQADIDIVRQSRAHGFLENKPAVVFGHRNKLTSEGPFLELLRVFQAELSKAQSLIVVGYSFRDPHINTYIADWINKSPDHKLTIIDPSFHGTRYAYDDGDFKWQLLNVNNSQPERVRIVNKPTSEALAEIFS